MELTGNVLIIGDSFCQDEHHWPTYLRTRLIYPEGVDKRDRIRTSSRPGASWWPIRHEFLGIKDGDPEWYSQIKIIIMIHTFKDRLLTTNEGVYRGNLTGQSYSLFTKTDEPVLASSLYYKYIHDEEFHNWAQIKWFDELAEAFQKTPDVRTVHLFTDSDTYNLIKYSKLNSVPNRLFIPTPLMDIVRLQYPTDCDPQRMARDGDHGFFNHFTPYNNIIFAKQVHEMMQFQRTDFDLTQFTPYD